MLTAVALATGCSGAGHPYRFASPLIGGADVPRRSPQPAVGDAREDAAPRLARGERRAPRARRADAPDPLPLPSAPRARPADEPRSWVGVQDDRDPVLAVLARCRARNPRCPTELPDRERWRPADAPIFAGDLLVFDRVGLDNRGQLVALVERQDPRGVFEIAYLAAGVWRRGFLDPTRPRLRRDGQGRVVNTFLRHYRARPPAGTKFLAGELLVGVISVEGDASVPKVADLR